MEKNPFNVQNATEVTKCQQPLKNISKLFIEERKLNAPCAKKVFVPKKVYEFILRQFMRRKGHMLVDFVVKDLDKNHISIPTLKENTKDKKIEPFDFDP